MSALFSISVLSFITVTTLSFFFYLVLSRWLKRNLTNGRNDRRSLMIIAGSGGHTAEMIRLVSGIDKRKYMPRIYVVAETDSTSAQKIRHFEQEKSLNTPVMIETKRDNHCQDDYMIVTIPRSRQVHQSWISTVLTTLRSTFASVLLISESKPDLILCNGPGTCVPVCIVALIFRAIKLIPTKIVYVESICRVYDLSLSGKILHRLVDKTVVQWSELHDKYPDSIFVGRLS